KAVVRRPARRPPDFGLCPFNDVDVIHPREPFPSVGYAIILNILRTRWLYYKDLLGITNSLGMTRGRVIVRDNDPLR
ncbi:hypothetical protein HAX54_030484, partial [Datura stramonium]|nr:hypothetical protein [Datura stramonium]